MRARLLGSFVLIFALALPALAQGRRGGSSLDRVLPHVRQTVPGRFYDAEGPFFGPSGHPTYRLKWMTPDGRIIWFGVDAETGQVLGGMPSGPPPGRYRDEDDRGSWGNRSRDNWPDNDGGGWGTGGGQEGWGNGGGQDRGWNRHGGGNGSGQGDHDGQGGWGGRGSNGGGDRSDHGRQGGWGGRGGGNGGGHGGQSGSHDGNDRGGGNGRHRPSGG